MNKRSKIPLIAFIIILLNIILFVGIYIKQKNDEKEIMELVRILEAKPEEWGVVERDLIKYGKRSLPYLEPLMFKDGSHSLMAIDIYLKIAGVDGVPKLLEVFGKKKQIDDKNAIIAEISFMKEKEALYYLVTFVEDENEECSISAYCLLVRNLIKNEPNKYYPVGLIEKIKNDIKFRKKLFNTWKDWLDRNIEHLTFNEESRCFLDMHSGDDSRARKTAEGILGDICTLKGYSL